MRAKGARKDRPDPPTLDLGSYRRVTDQHADVSYAAYCGILAYAADVREYERSTGRKVPWNDADPNAYAAQVAQDRGEQTPEPPPADRAARRRAQRR